MVGSGLGFLQLVMFEVWTVNCKFLIFIDVCSARRPCLQSLLIRKNLESLLFFLNSLLILNNWKKYALEIRPR